jgi:hypothetical protein
VVLELPNQFLFFCVQVVAVWRNRGRAHDRHAQGNIREASFLPLYLEGEGQGVDQCAEEGWLVSGSDSRESSTVPPFHEAWNRHGVRKIGS